MLNSDRWYREKLSEAQLRNRILLGKAMKKKIPLLKFLNIADEDVFASITDEPLVDGGFYLAEKLGINQEEIKAFLMGEEGDKKSKSEFHFE